MAPYLEPVHNESMRSRCAHVFLSFKVTARQAVQWQLFKWTRESIYLGATIFRSLFRRRSLCRSYTSLIWQMNLMMRYEETNGTSTKDGRRLWDISPWLSGLLGGGWSTKDLYSAKSIVYILKRFTERLTVEAWPAFARPPQLTEQQ